MGSGQIGSKWVPVCSGSEPKKWVPVGFGSGPKKVGSDPLWVEVLKKV